MEERRGHWYLITGFILGLAAGLVFAWLISPVHYVETAPDTLKAEFKDNYRVVIAAAYMADGDLGRAKARLILLNDSDHEQALASQAQSILAQGGSQVDARSLAVLAAALAQQRSETPTMVLTPTVVLTHTATPTKTIIIMSPTILTSFPVLPTLTQTVIPPATLTITPGMTKVAYTITSSIQPSLSNSLVPTTRTGTPFPSLTTTATQGLPFVLQERSQVCDQTSLQPMLQVQINDAAGKPVPGVKIQVTWQGGQDTFWTGLEPEISLGFADFQMIVGVTYTLQLADGGQPVNSISAIQCSDTGQSFWGGWYLQFQQPQP